MIRYNIFYKQFIVRKTGDFSKVGLFDNLKELPVGSILHTTSGLTTGFGKETHVVPDGAIYDRYIGEKKQSIFFVKAPSGDSASIPTVLSGLRPYKAGTTTAIKKYKTSNSSKIFFNNDPVDFGFSNTYQNVMAYEPLFKVIATGIDTEMRVFNMAFATVLNNIIELPDRDHFIVVETENTQFSKTNFLRSFKAYTRQTVVYRDSSYYMAVMHLMGMLHDESTDSFFDKVPDHVLAKTNLIFQNGEQFVVYNLGKLKELMEKNPSTMKLVITQLNRISQVAAFVTEEVNEDLVALPKSVDDKNTTKFNKTPSVEENAEASKAAIVKLDNEVFEDIIKDETLTEKQKEFVKVISQKYKAIEIGGETLEEILSSGVDAATDESNVGDVVGDIPDKSLAKSKLTNFDSEYMKVMFKKDLVASIVSFGKQGMFVTNIVEEDISDSLSNLIKYKVSFTDKDGKVHTVEFTIPKVDEDGNCKINGSIKSMTIQRVNTPICKVSAIRVSLSSNYNKSIVERNESFSNNFLKYIKRIMVKAKDVVSVNIGNNEYPKLALPYEYTQLASSYNGIEHKKFKWTFKYEERVPESDLDRILELESKYGVYIGTTESKESFLDVQGTLSIVNSSDSVSKTSILDLLNDTLEDIKFPQFNEWVNFNVLGKKLPVMIVLMYRYGLSTMLDYLKVKFETVGVNDRIKTSMMDIVIKLSDRKIIIRDPKIVLRLLFGGLAKFDLKEYTLEELSGKDAYYDLVLAKKISINYLKGLDDIFELFIDPITEDVLTQMGEPTNMRDLLIRATALLATEDFIEAASETNFRYRSYERFNDIVYKQLARALSTYRNKGSGSNNKFSINPYEILSAISSDPLFNNIDIVNPVDDLKIRHRFSHGGDGGRSKESMVIQDRRFPEDGVGIMSESTVDSGAVGIEGVLTTDPSVSNLRGLTTTKDIDDITPGELLSPTTALFPGADMDDSKRANFIALQMKHYIACAEKDMARVRTGYERVMAQRSRLPFAYPAKEDGKVIAVNEKLKTIAIEYKTAGSFVLGYGEEYAKNGGGGFYTPQKLVHNDLKNNQRFKKGDILLYNDGYFTKDVTSKQVDLSLGIYANVALMEGPGTVEDGSIISKKLQERLVSSPVWVRSITIPTTTTIHKAALPGTELVATDPLMIFDESDLGKIDIKDVDALKAIASINQSIPKAKYSGVVVKIEVLYRGEYKEMSDTVRALVREANREGKMKAKYSANADNADSFVAPGPISGDKVDGQIISDTDIVIKFYIKQDLDMNSGDKLVYAGSLKSVISSVEEEPMTTADGSKEIDAAIGVLSVQNRMVVTPIWGGIFEMIMEDVETKMLDLYFS